jgi:hypothetical protein
MYTAARHPLEKRRYYNLKEIALSGELALKESKNRYYVMLDSKLMKKLNLPRYELNFIR